MAFFLAYVTDNGAGYSALEAMDISHALTKAKTALHGLGCTSATLRQTIGSRPSFSEGHVVAGYTPAVGWQINETDGPI